MSLALRHLPFTTVVPGAGAVYAPWWILTRISASATPVVWYAAVFIAACAAPYVWCVWVFATAGFGTPGQRDAPRRFVAAGPCRWVRNPMYIAALLVVVGEAWLFLAVTLTLYVLVLAFGFHLFVVWYEEPTLRAHFGDEYDDYRHNVSRWIPRPP